MPSLKTYDLFISHMWRPSDNAEYYRLEAMLKSAPFFQWRNYSVPRHDPLGTKSDAQLLLALDRQIRPVNCFVVVAGMYVNHRHWIQREIETARSYNKPIIGVAPWGQQRIPIEVQNVAFEVVGWQTQSVVDAIRRWSL